MRRETFPVAGPLEVAVHFTKGDVAVTTAETSEATVTVEALNGRAEKALEDVTIELHGDRLVVEYGTGVRFGIVVRDPSFRVRVTVPHDSRLDVGTVSADVRADGRYASADVKTVSADVVIEDVAGDAKLKSVSGNVQLGRAGGRVAANTVSGDVELGEAASGADVKTVSGNQSIDSLTEGQARLNSVSGDIRVGIRRGSGVWFDVKSASGKTVSELEPADGPVADAPSVELHAKAVSGDIRIVRAA
jgi:DUF4097 and DUF4098 domain-containing protein YvlB